MIVVILRFWLLAILRMILLLPLPAMEEQVQVVLTAGLLPIQEAALVVQMDVKGHAEPELIHVNSGNIMQWIALILV
jgi:hypothetical protein